MHWVSKDHARSACVRGVVLVVLLGATSSEAQLPHLVGGHPANSASPASPLGTTLAEALAETAESGRGGVTIASLNLREGPATSYARVALLHEGRDIQVLREDGDWFYVTASQSEGWVHRDFVRLVPSEPMPSEVVSELDRLRDAEESWSDERESLSRRILKLEEDREDLQRALRDLRGEVRFGGSTDTTEEASASDRDSSKLRRELSELQERLDTLQSERSDLLAALDAVREEFSRSQAETATQVGDLERALGQAESDLAELRRVNAEPVETPEVTAMLEALKDQHETERQQLRAELTASEQARESLWANMATLQQENGSLRGQVQSLGGTVPMAPTGRVDELMPSTDLGADIDALLSDRVVAWATAWSGQSFNAYLDYYSADFVPAAEMSLDAWRALRESRLSRPEFIRVSTDEVTVDRVGPGMATTTFAQDYESNRYSDRVTKRLDWVEEGGVWRIVAESSQPIR